MIYTVSLKNNVGFYELSANQARRKAEDETDPALKKFYFSLASGYEKDAKKELENLVNNNYFQEDINRLQQYNQYAESTLSKCREELQIPAFPTCYK